MAKKFEEKYEKIYATNDVGGYAGEPGGGVAVDEPTIEEKRAFAKGLYKITKEELGKVITDLEAKCPKALVKNAAEDEVEINVDNITAVTFKEVMEYVNSCCAAGANGPCGGGGGTRKKKTAKRART